MAGMTRLSSAPVEGRNYRPQSHDHSIARHPNPKKSPQSPPLIPLKFPPQLETINQA
jgi:hypothetical protein